MQSKYGTFAVLRNFTLTLVALVISSTPAFSDAIPYPSVGTPITSPPAIIATGNVSSVLFFVGFSAIDIDVIDLFDITKGTQTGYVFMNQSTPVGASVSMATTAGDILVVEIMDESGIPGKYEGAYYSSSAAPSGTFSCIPASFGACVGVPPTPAPDSEIGVSHAYVTSVSSSSIDGVSLPAGSNTFVGLEDRSAAEGSDYDYNDDEFVLTGTSISPDPEPSSIALFGTGMLAVATVIRRRLTL